MRRLGDANGIERKRVDDGRKDKWSMTDSSCDETYLESSWVGQKSTNQQLFTLNAFIWGFLLGFCIFWYSVESGHYRPKSAEAKSQFSRATE